MRVEKTLGNFIVILRRNLINTQKAFGNIIVKLRRHMVTSQKY